MTGVDLNPWSAKAAALATPPDVRINYQTGDLFDLTPDTSCDVVISALFTHHLDDMLLIRFLRWMEGHAALGWFSNDLHRHAISHTFARAMVAPCRSTGWSSTTRRCRSPVHSPVRDWERLLAEAGFAPGAVSVEWFTPFRYGVGRIK